MDRVSLPILTLFLVSLILKVYSSQLGSPCTKDKDCKVGNSQCVSGICACKYYHAPLNNTACLESKLLDKDCITSEQCFLRVANSTCRDGQCQCSEGFIRFRKHTCLGPAQSGEVCYSDEHCRLHNKKSYCKFLIPKLFGKCACEREGLCGNNETAQFATETTMTEESVKTEKLVEVSTVEVEKNSETEIQTEENVWNGQNPENGDKKFSDPFFHQKEHLQVNSTTEEKQNISSTEVKLEISETSTPVDENRVSSRPQIRGEIQERDDTKISINFNNIKAVSLGFPCQTDIECQKNDNESRCINNICDCFFKSNNTNGCSSDNTGCSPETFQCRSTGQCISWFFVCDGREDCPDKSDEECGGPECPKSSFQCKIGGPCVSLAVLCDGFRNCPNGEDERLCLPENRNATQGCPKNTFQCTDGKCLPNYEFCNANPKCSDGSDESPAFCGSQSRYKKANTKYCPFQCTNGRCKSTAIVCSGRDGCGDSSDETQCSVCRCLKI